MPYVKVAGLLFVVLLTIAGLSPLAFPDPSSALTENLLINPGFEAGRTGWQVEPSTATFDLVSAPAHGGERAASLTKVTARGRALIYQEIPVTAGQRYSAQVWTIWNDTQLSNVKLRVEWRDEAGNRLEPRAESSADARSPEYQPLQLRDLQAPQDAVTARIEGYTYINQPGPEQPALFDDFVFATVGSLAITPEPSPLATRTPTVALPVPTASPTPTPLHMPPGAVVINEVFYDPPAPGGDPDDEWVELHNTADRTVNLGGWVLADHIGEDALPAVELPPGSFVVVAASESFQSLFPSYEGLLIILESPIGNGLANGGDSLWLRDDSGRTIDAMAYGDDTVAMFPSVPACPEGYSLERVPAGRDTDTAGDWFPRPVPSPGQGIDIRRLYLPILVR